jgi:hypothetical protein
MSQAGFDVVNGSLCSPAIAGDGRYSSRDSVSPFFMVAFAVTVVLPAERKRVLSEALVGFHAATGF